MRCGCNTCANLNHKRRFIRDLDPGAAYSGNDPVCDFFRIRADHAGEQDHEFIAHPATDAIIGAAFLADGLRDNTQNLITGFNAEGIINDLKVIDIQRDQT